MKVLTEVWKRRSKLTGKFEYLGSYNYYSSKGKGKETALITKNTYVLFRKDPATFLNNSVEGTYHIQS